MIEYLLLFKSIHIVGAVAWFGGLFYLVRIFVYHIEALQFEDPKRGILTDQYKIMEQRVYYIICIPAMLITWIFGSIMIAAYLDVQGLEWLKANAWMHSKLLLVILLSGYQHYTKSLMKKLGSGETSLSSFNMRLLNEVPTIFLLAIVLLAVYRNTLNSIYAFIGIFIFGIILFLGARYYKSIRSKSS